MSTEDLSTNTPETPLPQDAATPLYTGPTAADLAHIPEAMKERRQWILWRGVDKIDNKTGEVKGLDKVPYHPQRLYKTSAHNPDSWYTLDYCMTVLEAALEGWQFEDPAAYRGGGIGFVFTEQDDFFGFDTDKCRDPTTGDIKPQALAYLQRLNTYTEVSQSRKGLHAIGRGKLPPGGNRKDQEHVELYDTGRFFVVTGWHLPGMPVTIEPRQAELTALHATIFGSPQPPQLPSSTQTTASLMDDTDLLAKATKARNKAKFAALWNGDTSLHNSDDSSADLALCMQLNFYTPDIAQIDRLFRQSKLMRPKWDEQHGEQTYGQLTIKKALALQTQHYKPRNASGTQAPTPGWLPYGDTYNARRLVETFGTDLRYCGPWRKWLVWSDTHWQPDDTGKLMRRAKDTIESLLDLVKDLPTIADQQMLLAHIKTSLATSKLKAMIESAQSELPIPVLPGDLDCDHWLLNCLSGTIDLRTGALQPHLREDLLTRCIPVAYDPDASCPTWEDFLWRIMGGTDASKDSADDSALALESRQKADERATRFIDFLQRVIGYSLTGDTREQCLLMLHGKGSNGKSTFLEVLQALLSEYGQSTPSATLLVKDRHEGIPNDIARLRGARLVTAVEIGEGKRLDEELVKRLTGQDTMTGRFLHAEFFDFKPEFKLWLACNHLPQIRGTDHAIWRRVKRIPFNVVIPDKEQDKTLLSKLRAELPGILQWAIRGCLVWQRKGLMEPEEVQTATQEYKASMDTLGQFIEDCCLTGPNYNGKASVLYEAYKRWCDQGGEPIATQKAWGTALTERGYERYPNNGTWYRGIAARDTPKEIDSSQKNSRSANPRRI